MFSLDVVTPLSSSLKCVRIINHQTLDYSSVHVSLHGKGWAQYFWLGFALVLLGWKPGPHTSQASWRFFKATGGSSALPRAATGFLGAVLSRDRAKPRRTTELQAWHRVRSYPRWCLWFPPVRPSPLPHRPCPCAPVVSLARGQKQQTLHQHHRTPRQVVGWCREDTPHTLLSGKPGARPAVPTAAVAAANSEGSGDSKVVQVTSVFTSTLEGHCSQLFYIIVL